MVLELHMLQNFAPSCLNRDDTNAPKDCIFGGVRRGRISSQCLKRAIRWHPALAEHLGVAAGLRTKRLLQKLCDDLAAVGHDRDSAERIVPPVLEALLGQLGPEGKGRVLIHLGRDEIERLTALIVEHWQELDEASQAPDGPRTRRRSPISQLAGKIAGSFTVGTAAPDIALFGRMIAENANFNVEAACQMAHAISTHRTTMEMDFFSAVDDLKPTHRGSEMIGTIEFNSACYYRYSAVSVEQLLANLNNDRELAAMTLAGFMEASIEALPAGRQHGMSAANPPSFIMAVTRSSGPSWSLVNAFERPVSVGPNERLGLVAKSLMMLDGYWAGLLRMYGQRGIEACPACWMEEAPVSALADQRVQSIQEVIDLAMEASGLEDD